MKKIIAFLLTTVMSFTLLTGCGNPVYDDFENFLNVEMTEINANYDKIKTEAAGWQSVEDEAEIVSSITDVLLPLVDDSLQRLDKIAPETEEVRELKDKYAAVMNAYKEGFNTMLEGVQNADEDKMLSGSESIEHGMELLEEYNAALETLAEEVGAEIEY